MDVTNNDGITAQWSIQTHGRVARVNGLTLVNTNGRTQGGWGPVVWRVILEDGDEQVEVARGEVWQGTRYSALVRQAMFDAEQAARAF